MTLFEIRGHDLHMRSADRLDPKSLAKQPRRFFAEEGLALRQIPATIPALLERMGAGVV